ncbi:MAG TPA: GntG family PLP-dependent aldolase, partial [Acidobacteriaceae bacterium]|nr:GntG family PLP-dependent aldolase [Acidobacteriaceae bacterium]
EGGGASVLGGVVLRPVPTMPTGELPLDLLEASVHSSGDPHQAQTRLICLENTHNRCGGVVLSPEYMGAVRAFAQARGLSVHLDGARVFNAAVSLGVDVREITQHVDSVMFCLSKGLSAPVGSMLAGDAAFIQRARRIRKMVGGGMRQAGVLAAAGLIALEEGPQRLHEDHANARLLADALAMSPAIDLDPASVQTNIVIFRLRRPNAAEGLVRGLKERGVLAGSVGRDKVRFVTHRDVSRAACEQAARIAVEIAANLA